MTLETRWKTLTYSAELRVARVLFDYLAGIDPGAVRLAQTILGLFPRRGVAKRNQ
jgi:hypothetical protein